MEDKRNDDKKDDKNDDKKDAIDHRSNEEKAYVINNFMQQEFYSKFYQKPSSKRGDVVKENYKFWETQPVNQFNCTYVNEVKLY